MLYILDSKSFILEKLIYKYTLTSLHEKEAIHWLLKNKPLFLLTTYQLVQYMTDY